MMKNVILVGIGGMLGSIARYLAVVYITDRTSSRFPLGTFSVNIVGCLLIGVIAGLSERFNLLPEYRVFLSAGICAGFTTFSSFAFENVRLLQDKDHLTFVLYTVSSLVLGIVAIVVGLVLTRA